ncbi:MAG TPA: tetratricopeptide repeat protein [Candidatus Polarisedimenticolaceae bacterium]
MSMVSFPMIVALLVASPADVPADLWNDPTFKQQFTGTYAILPDVEPKPTGSDRLVFEKVQPLMATNREEARLQLEKAATEAPSALVDLTLGNLAFEAGDLDEAGRRYEAAIGKFPPFRRAERALGLVRFRQGRFEEAAKHLTRAIELGNVDGLSYGLLATCLSGAGDFVAAETAYRQAILFQPGNQDWRLGLARSAFKQRKYGEASALLDTMIAGRPDRAELWQLQASAWLGLGDRAKAAENLEVVYRLGKAAPETLYTLGDLYGAESNWDLAADAYRRAVAADPRQPAASALRSAETLSQRGALEQGKALTREIASTLGASLGEEDRRRLLKLQARIAVAEGSSDEAARVLEEVVAADPLDGDALILLGQHAAKAGDVERARLLYERAAGIDAFEGQAKTRLAQLLAGQGKYQEAIPLLKRAQEIKPRDEIARYLEQVERLARQTR